MKKDTNRKRCKTCNSPHRLEAEELYLRQGKSGAYISRHLYDKYGFKITPQALLNHFRICLDKKGRIEEAEKKSEKLRKEILKRKNKIADLVWEIISYLAAINIMFHEKVMSKAGEGIGRTKSDLIRTYTGEFREYVKLYQNLIEENGGGNFNEAQVIAAYEEYRKKNAELLKNIKSYEIKEDSDGEINDK